MAVRAIQARIICERQDLTRLWNTHCALNQRLPAIISVLLKMRRGEVGETPEQRANVKAFGAALLKLNAQQAYDTFNKAASGSTKNTTLRKLLSNDAAASAVLDDLARGFRPLAEAKASLQDVPNNLERKIIEEACAVLRGHMALTSLWTQEHEAWKEKKAEWEAEHPEYLALKPNFEEFEKAAGGPATKRRQRWHKYLAWLRSRPDLAAWRGGPAVVNPLTPAAQEQDRIRRAWPVKRIAKEFEEFWKLNPDLRELDRLHGYYEREFVRRRKRKRNPDGFNHPPTFTLPHSVRHPRWLVFNAPQTSPQGYADLAIPKPGGIGSIRLRLTGGGGRTGEWVTLRFKADPRLSDFYPCKKPTVFGTGKNKGAPKETDAYLFFDRQLGLEREAQISGAKLMFRRIRLHDDGSLRSADAYLVFTCNITELPVSEKAKALKWEEAGGLTKSGKPRKSVRIPDHLVACAVDLGIRHLGFATLAEYRDGKPHLLRSRNLWIAHEEADGAHPGRWAEGPELAHIARHKKKIRKLRRLRGKPVHGQESHVRLQDHITDMGEDRFKKGARAIINFALNSGRAVDRRTGQPFPRADLLLLENMKGSLLPDAERERGINRALVSWNRGQLVKRVKEMARDVGLEGPRGWPRIFELPPFGTSQVCSKCGDLGRRYSIRPDPESHAPDIHFGFVEKLFACPCGYRANADHNASMNLHRRFSMGESAIKAFADLQNLPDTKKRERLEALEESLRPSLRRMHGLSRAAAAAEGPF